MIIAKQKISSLTIQFNPGEPVTGLSKHEEERLISLGVVQCVEELANTENMEERKEIVWFKEVMENTVLKEKIEYAERGEINIGKNKTNKDLLEILVSDAVTNGVDVQAFSEPQLFSFAEKMGIEIVGKDNETIIAEIEAGFDNV